MTGGWNIHMKNQPANSPDFNVLDLGIFNAMVKSQSRIVKHSIYGAFEELPSFKINHCFLTLMCLMFEVIISRENNYSLPNMHKHALAKARALPERMQLKDDALKCLDIGPAGISFHNAVIMVVNDHGEDDVNNDN